MASRRSLLNARPPHPRPALGHCIVAAALLAGCAGSGQSIVMATPSGGETASAIAPVTSWTPRVREHLDLWLHGFALLHRDSTLVPYFRPGYRDRVMAERRRLGVSTALDGGAERLRARLVANPAMVNAQFVALYFESWDELRRAIDLFLQLGGDPRAAGDRRSVEAVATMAAYFPTAADRDWLQEFIGALDEEREHFFAQYWRSEQRRLGPAFDRADALWRDTYRARFSTFLHNARQREGELLVALALAGEGRTLTGNDRTTTVAVGYPADTAHAAELVYVLAHEIVGTVANSVVLDNTSPAQRRSGESDQWASLAAVLGGAM